MSHLVINVPTKDLLVPYTKRSFQIMVGTFISITIAMFVNAKQRYNDKCCCHVRLNSSSSDHLPSSCVWVQLNPAPSPQGNNTSSMLPESWQFGNYNGILVPVRTNFGLRRRSGKTYTLSPQAPHRPFLILGKGGRLASWRRLTLETWANTLFTASFF